MLIHRFWWNQHNKPIPHNGLLSLRSLCPQRQRVWTYSVQIVTDQVGHFPGVEVIDAGSLLAADFAREVVGRGWHVVLLKDLISALALWAHGGLFLDLDYIYAGGELPLTASFCAGAEPIKMNPPQRRPSRFFHVDGVTVGVNVGVLYAAAGSSCAAAWAKAVFHHWIKEGPSPIRQSFQYHRPHIQLVDVEHPRTS